MRNIATLLLLLPLPHLAWSHAGSHESDHLNWSLWNVQYHILFMLIALALSYYFGYKRLKSIAKFENKKLRAKALSYYAGLVILFFALLSPIDTMSDVLGWAHMLQHTLILMIAAPLMALGGPNHISQWSLSREAWKKIGKLRFIFVKFFSASRFNRPITAWFIYILTLSLWHIPTFYEAALRWEWLHDIQHLLFFVTSYFFWRVLFDPFQINLSPLTGIIYCFVASLHGIILGVLMTLSPEAWYGPYILSAPLYGYDPLTDQQLAGLIMWMPAGASYALAALALLMKAFKQSGLIRES